MYDDNELLNRIGKLSEYEFLKNRDYLNIQRLLSRQI